MTLRLPFRVRGSPPPVSHNPVEITVNFKIFWLFVSENLNVTFKPLNEKVNDVYLGHSGILDADGCVLNSLQSKQLHNIHGLLF